MTVDKKESGGYYLRRRISKGDEIIVVLFWALYSPPYKETYHGTRNDSQ
jgi:hypothetical protein